MMNYALSINAVSAKFKAHLEDTLQQPIHYLLISELRKQSLFTILRTLRKSKINCLLLPLESKNAELFLPLLVIFSILIGAKRIIVVYEDLSWVRFYKYQAITATLKIMTRSVFAYFIYLYSKLEVAKLSTLPLENYPSTASKRILYLDATLWFGEKAGGSVGHIAGVINALSQRGYVVEYAAESRLPMLVESVNFIKTQPPSVFTIPAELNLFHYNKKMIQQLSKQANQYQFIYQRLSSENYTGVKLSKILNLPLVIEHNGSVVWIAKHWAKPLKFENMAKKCESLCLSQAHLIVTISDIIKDELVDQGISANKIVSYPNCINPNIFNPEKFSLSLCRQLRKQLCIPEQAIVFTFIGTFNEWHGIDQLTVAIRNFIDNYPELVNQYQPRFLLIGDGPKMALLQTELNQATYRKYIVLTGLISQELVPQYLAISDVCLSPHVHYQNSNRFFGSPTKLFEYMAMGKAIIASDLEQIGHVLRNSLIANQLPELSPVVHASELGILCQPANIEHIIKAISFLIKSPQWRIQLGNNARNAVLAKYTWDHHVSIILERLNKGLVC